jgi:hypothetical protein
VLSSRITLTSTKNKQTNKPKGRARKWSFEESEKETGDYFLVTERRCLNILQFVIEAMQSKAALILSLFLFIQRT